MTTEFEWKEATNIYNFKMNDINGEEFCLKKYEGQVVLIVNVASNCGLTNSNYKELVELDEKYGESHGLKILACPCNQFGLQEPGSSTEICEFVKNKNAKFDFTEKINVNGDQAHPLWKYLKMQKSGLLGNCIKWNFTKFIIDKNGKPVERFGPKTSYKKIKESLEKYF